MRALATLLLALRVLAPETPEETKALATELLAQADATARERWLDAHRASLDAALGREVASQARALYLDSRYDPAYDAFTLAVRIGEVASDPETRIRGLEGLGGVERFRGRSQEALPYLERAMQEADAIGDRAAAGRILGGLSSAHRRLGEFGEALALSERQLALFQELGDAEWTGRAHNNIGIALGSLGRCPEALAHLEASRDASAAAGDSGALTNAWSNIGLCHQLLGNYGAALDALGRSLEIAQAAGKESELPSTFNNIGELYRLQGASARALDYYHRAYATAAASGEKEFMADALINEGGALLESGQAAEAGAAFARALALGQEMHSPTVITQASEGAADILSLQGDRPGALRLLEASLDAAEHTEDLALAVRSRRQIASLELVDGKAAEAQVRARRAAEDARRYELREELWPALLVVAQAQRALGQPRDAEATLHEAIAVVEELRDHAVGPDADRAVFLVPRAAPYQELVSLLVDEGRPWDALAIAERTKGRALLDVLSGGRRTIGTSLSATEAAEEQRLEGTLLTLNSELRDLVQRPSPDPARQGDLEKRRGAARLAVEDWRARAYAAHPALRVLRGDSQALTTSDVATLLADERVVMLEYVLGPRQAWVFVLAGGPGASAAPEVHRLGLEAPELTRLVRTFRERLATRDLDFADLASRLHRVLLAPVAGALAKTSRVVIVPDGALWDLPFQALRAADGRFLVEERTVSYVPSLTVLRDMRSHVRPSVRPEGELLALATAALGPQARALADLYGAGHAKLAVGAEAQEAWLKQQAPGYRILHLATHGTLDDASPLYSALEMATPAPGVHEDGLLEAREILNLDLGAELAVLSACETGRGHVGAGEGLIGMTWAFFVAGCPATLASQWKVEAASTSRLMLAFHRGLRAGLAPAEALRRADLALLRLPAERHPFYWAGFVAMGDADSRLGGAPR